MNRFRAILKKIRARRGMTFVELLIAVLISFIILAAIFEVFIAQKKRYVTEDAMLEVENRGDFAIEYLTRMVQNSGFNIKEGMKIETASDHYFTTVMDENDNGVIEPGEIITIALNKPYREIKTTEQPTELVRDPDLDDFTAGGRKFFFDVFFDMDGDGVVADTEKFVSGYDLNTPRNDASLDQKDAIKLYLTGPPYAIYRYSYRLLNEAAAYSAGNPYIVNPEPDLIAGNVDNFIIRYFDEEDLPLPVTTDNNGNRITPNPPYNLSREETAKIRRVDFEILLKSAREDAKWTDTGTYPVGSVASYGTDGKPAGWSCGDADFRDAEPYLTNCAGLSDWDCFTKYCNNKEYQSGGAPIEKVPYQDNYRRLLLSSSVTPKNLTLNPYGQLILSVDPPRVRCPDTYGTLTAVLKDRQGDPMPNAVVNFYSTSLVSTLDYTDVSNKNGDGKPITDANGVVTGIKLKAIVQPDGKKKPVTVTVSADTSISVVVDGVTRLFPVYSSAIVPFIVGPPKSVELINPPTSTRACTTDDAYIREFVVHAKDCNDFDVEGATITIAPYDPAFPNAAIPGNIDPGTFYTKKSGRTPSDVITGTKGMADYSTNAIDSGKYVAFYEPPLATDATPPKDTYYPSLGIRVTATAFENKPLTDAEPNGWGFSTNPNVTCNFAVEPGAIDAITSTPDSYSGAGCRNNFLNLYVTGLDCGRKNTYSLYDMWGSILAKDTDNVFKASPPLSSGDILGTLTKTNGTVLGMYNVALSGSLIWDNEDQKYRLVFLNTGCAASTKQERVEFLNYTRGGSVPANPVSGHTEIDMTQCPIGLNITLRAREPHTTPTKGNGTLTDGFYQNGCNYDNLDVEALVILNLPPTTLCQDITLNPVTFTIESGGARFLDASNNPTLTTVTVNTDSTGRSIAPIKLTGTSLTSVVIRANSTFGTSPVYTAMTRITLPVGPPRIVFAYRNNCYTDLLSPANAVRNGDYIYIEVRDCNRNKNINAAETVTATALEHLGSFNDSESVTLTETGNSTGVFRGKIRSRALPIGWTPTVNDGILDLTNAGQLNVRYLDESLNIYQAYDDPGPYIQNVLDLCGSGIKFMEVFANSAYDSLTSDATNFPLVYPGNWKGFSTLNITRHTTTPTLNPSGTTVKKLMLQFCDEFYLSGSIFTKFFWNGSTASFPPSSTPDAKWRNTESFMWVDLDESVVGTSGSEKNWKDLVVSYRFKFLGNPDDTGYGTGTSVTVPDYYLPGVTKGVYFIFRGGASSKTMSGLSGTPTMDILDRGYIAVWTKDASGNPVAKLFRVDGVDESANPVTMDVVQVGGDITAPDFNIGYDSPGFHKAEIVLEGDNFYIYFDDVFMDFDGESGPSAIGGASAVDKNYVDGTIGFGVKDVIAKFDNIQVCGCPPMKITTSNANFPTGVPVTLTMKDSIYDTAALGPVTWAETPSGCGEFSANPSPSAAVLFTRDFFGVFPTRFDAVDALGCAAIFLTTPAPATCLTQNFESYTNGAAPNATDFASCIGTWKVATDSSNKGLTYNVSSCSGGNCSGTKTIRAADTYQAIWANNSLDTYDDYNAQIEVRPTATTITSALTFRNTTSTCSSYYWLSVSRAGSGRVKVDFNYHSSSGTDETLDTFTHGSISFSTGTAGTPVYRLWIQGNGPTIDYSVTRISDSTVIYSGTVTDTRAKIGPPGFRLSDSGGTISSTKNAFFDNFKICTLP